MNCHQTAELKATVGSSAARLKPDRWGHHWWMKWRQGGGLLWCVLYCFVGPPWTRGCFDTETRAKRLFFSTPSGSPCGLMPSCSVLLLAIGARLKRGGGSRGGDRASAYQARGCLILRRHCLKGCRGRQRNWSD